MTIDENTLALIKAAGLNFFVQENDIIQLAIDKKLGGTPYLQPYECSIATASWNTAGEDNYDDELNGTTSSKQKFIIPNDQIWVLTKITHRDIEAGIFYAQMAIDGMPIFPKTLMESAYFLMDFPKSVICTRYIECRIYNDDTATKTYRHLRHWQIYSRALVNDFLEEYGLERLR